MSNSFVKQSIDDAFREHMKSLFANLAKHIEGGHIDQGRTAFRKALAAANQARTEMRAIVEEQEGA